LNGNDCVIHFLQLHFHNLVFKIDANG
jgi:hypothetical protein